MALRAVTSIQHYQEAGPPPETERVLIPAGESVDEGLFSDEELQELKDLGAVVEDSDLDKERELQDQVNELSAKLEALRQENEGLKARQTSPGTLLQTQAVTEENVDELGENNDPAPSGATPKTQAEDAAGGKVVKDGKVQK